MSGFFDVREQGLSELGRARRDPILGGMRRAAQQRRRRRHAVAALGAALPVVAVAVVAMAVGLKPPPARAPRIADAKPTVVPAPAEPAAPPAPALAMRHAHLEIADAPGPTRIQVLSGDLTLPVAIIDDESLSAELRSAGLNPGIVRTGAGVTVLATARLVPSAQQ
jgi:hypothetical protein